MNDPFEIVGVRPELLERQAPEKENRWYQGVPWLSVIVLLIIAGGCLFCKWIMPKDPSYMDLKNYTVAPCREFLFGTDTMGRDIFSMIWYGGRQSLFIGFVATMISTSIAIIFGTVSGLAPEWLDMLLMRMTEILLSIPNLLLVIFLQAILGKANVLSLSLVIGVTSWTGIAKIVRTEVRQLRSNEYVVAARCMGGGFFYVLRKYLAPHFLSSIMFMVVTNIGAAIGTEATLSFLGIGLPVEIISWGSMLSNADQALLSNDWWIILIPGLFLVVTLVCITDIGNYIRKRNNRGMREI